jgi:hypothetical protein
MIRENLNTIQNRIEEACENSGREADSVILIAVSKTKPVKMIEEALNAGQQHFGENRMQELQDKMESFDHEDAVWHMIGTLQSNKIKYIAGRVDWIHSAAKSSHLKEINKRAAQHDRIINVLVQVNISDEEQKSGCEPDELPAIIDYAKKCQNIRLRGLMGIAELVEDPEEVRPQFRALKKMLDEHKHLNGGNVQLEHLSMGMTNDLEVAIEEGATMIRVGRAIFGERNYT